MTSFELIARVCLELVFKHIPGARDPLPAVHPWYVLVELSDSTPGDALAALFEESLGAAIEAGLVPDAALAASRAQQQEFWKLRENISEAQKVEGPSIKHDVSVPVSRVAEFIERADAEVTKRFPDVRIVAFGHAGDGNIHYNCSMTPTPLNGDPRSSRGEAAAFFTQSPEVNHLVYEVVTSLNGSISAEHGLGQLKREEITRYKSALELDLMRAIKRTLDPKGLMNPGKVL